MLNRCPTLLRDYHIDSVCGDPDRCYTCAAILDGQNALQILSKRMRRVPIPNTPPVLNKRKDLIGDPEVLHACVTSHKTKHDELNDVEDKHNLPPPSFLELAGTENNRSTDDSHAKSSSGYSNSERQHDIPNLVVYKEAQY